jgi:hypothetical protein
MGEGGTRLVSRLGLWGPIMFIKFLYVKEGFIDSRFLVSGTN